MDHRSISFRAGPYHCSNHLASSWRSWLMVLLRCVAARSSSCWRLFERRRTSWSRVYSVSCTASDHVLLYVDLIQLAERRSYCQHFHSHDCVLKARDSDLLLPVWCIPCSSVPFTWRESWRESNLFRHRTRSVYIYLVFASQRQSHGKFRYITSFAVATWPTISIFLLYINQKTCMSSSSK